MTPRTFWEKLFEHWLWPWNWWVEFLQCKADRFDVKERGFWGCQRHRWHKLPHIDCNCVPFYNDEAFLLYDHDARKKLIKEHDDNQNQS